MLLANFAGESGTVKEIIERNKQQGAAENPRPKSIEYTPSSIQKFFESKKNEVIYLGTSRDIQYNTVNSLQGTKRMLPSDVNEVLLSGEASKYIVNWIANRFAFLNVEGSLKDSAKKNYKIALNALNGLDKDTKFKTVEADTLDIVLSTNRGDVYLKDMCSGYKSCLYLIIGIIDEIENRFDQMSIEEFNGVILIDEIDGHLHPTWQNKIVQILKDTFPNAQLIMTTHSPSILQNLKKEEIIPLMRDEEGNVLVKELHLGEYGLQGWTLEEIMEDVMGMPTTRSETFETVKNAFDKAMNHEDTEEIKRTHQILEKMLHPDNVLKTLLRIQTAGMEE